MVKYILSEWYVHFFARFVAVMDLEKRKVVWTNDVKPLRKRCIFYFYGVQLLPECNTFHNFSNKENTDIQHKPNFDQASKLWEAKWVISNMQKVVFPRTVLGAL